MHSGSPSIAPTFRRSAKACAKACANSARCVSTSLFRDCRNKRLDRYWRGPVPTDRLGRERAGAITGPVNGCHAKLNESSKIGWEAAGWGRQPALNVMRSHFEGPLFSSSSMRAKCADISVYWSTLLEHVVLVYGSKVPFAARASSLLWNKQVFSVAQMQNVHVPIGRTNHLAIPRPHMPSFCLASDSLGVRILTASLL